MKKVMLVFGTRPEAIKMCPIVKELMKSDTIRPVVCVTGQHREMLNQVLDIFKISPDFDLNIMKKNQDLYDITIEVLRGMKLLLRKERPDMVLVHGDTTTAYAAAVAAFYEKIPVGHIEAGLRTGRLDIPFPEEFNRQQIGIIADLHFAPTEMARDNLIKENKRQDNIFVTGNTSIDALFSMINNDFEDEILDWAKDSRLIVVTAHRRENQGEPMHNMFRAIRRVVEEFDDVKAVYPVHMNPVVREIAKKELNECSKIKLTEPMGVNRFQNILNKSYLILTDSGGIQEEAPALGKPVLVMRDTTERPEGVEAGTLIITGTDEKSIYKNCKTLLTDFTKYSKMSKAVNPYGNGTASIQIRRILEEKIFNDDSK